MEKPRDLAHLIEAFVGWVSGATLDTPRPLDNSKVEV
jgi:hypothetical protein